MKTSHVIDALCPGEPFEGSLRTLRMPRPLGAAQQRGQAIERLVQIIPPEAPHQEAPAAGNGHALGNIIQHDVLVVLPAIHEHGNGPLIRCIIGPEHEIGFAGDAHVVPLIQQHLWLQPPAPARTLQPPDLLAPEKPLPQLECEPFGFAAQHFHEALFQNAFKQGVARRGRQLRNRLELRPMRQHLLQQAECRAARDQRPVVIVAVAVDAAIAAIGVALPGTGTVTQRMMGALEYLIQRRRIAHQLLQVSGTSGYAVVDDHEALRALPVQYRCRRGRALYLLVCHAHVGRNAQMGHRPMKTLGKAQLDGRNEAQQGATPLGETHLRQEQPDALTGKLPVQEDALLPLCGQILAA